MSKERSDEAGVGTGKKLVTTRVGERDNPVLMIEPSAITRVACAQACVELGVRLAAATEATIDVVSASTRPLVIVVARESMPRREHLTDIAVGVGAQVVVTDEEEDGSLLVERVKLAARAALAMREGQS